MTATRLRNGLSAFSVLLLAMQWATVSAQAQIPVTTCGTVISAPGNYVLANDLLGCPGNGIDIRSGGVVLDLNTHQITGTNTLLSRGIEVSPSTRRVSIVGPGTIISFSIGVYYERARDGASITLVTSQNNDRIGFLIAASRGVTLTGNTAVNNGQEGFVLLNTNDSGLSENIANTNREAGIRIIGQRNQIVLNTADSNGAYGIEVDDFLDSRDNRIVSNTAMGNPRFDLAERGSGECRSVWRGNMFNTANLPCIH